MADQKRWFKVWTSILSDPDISELSLEDVGRWVFLGALIAEHGERGSVALGEKTIRSKFQIPSLESIEEAFNRLPNVVLRRLENDNGKFIVTMNNWNKYQIDSTGYERQKRYRQHQNDNGLRGEEKRREEIRREKKDIGANGSHPASLSDSEWLLTIKSRPAYQGIDVEREFEKMKTWCEVNKKDPTRRRFVNWLNRADKPFSASGQSEAEIAEARRIRNEFFGRST